MAAFSERQKRKILASLPDYPFIFERKTALNNSTNRRAAMKRVAPCAMSLDAFDAALRVTVGTTTFRHAANKNVPHRTHEKLY